MSPNRFIPAQRIESCFFWLGVQKGPLASQMGLVRKNSSPKHPLWVRQSLPKKQLAAAALPGMACPDLMPSRWLWLPTGLPNRRMGRGLRLLLSPLGLFLISLPGPPLSLYGVEASRICSGFLSPLPFC